MWGYGKVFDRESVSRSVSRSGRRGRGGGVWKGVSQQVFEWQKKVCEQVSGSELVC